MDRYPKDSGFGVHDVEVRLMRGMSRRTIITQVGGNTRGLNVLKAAVENIYDGPAIQNKDSMRYIILLDPEGKQRLVYDRKGRGLAWLENLVVGCKIIRYTPNAEQGK